MKKLTILILTISILKKPYLDSLAAWEILNILPIVKPNLILLSIEELDIPVNRFYHKRQLSEIYDRKVRNYSFRDILIISFSILGISSIEDWSYAWVVCTLHISINLVTYHAYFVIFDIREITPYQPNNFRVRLWGEIFFSGYGNQVKVIFHIKAAVSKYFIFLSRVISVWEGYYLYTLTFQTDYSFSSIGSLLIRMMDVLWLL